MQDSQIALVFVRCKRRFGERKPKLNTLMSIHMNVHGMTGVSSSVKQSIAVNICEYTREYTHEYTREYTHEYIREYTHTQS